MAPRVRRQERHVSPLEDYDSEPRVPPAYFAQTGQSTTTYPSGNTASYYLPNPAPIQPVQQPSGQHYSPYAYLPQTQDSNYNQDAYLQQSQDPYHSQDAYPQQSQEPYLHDDAYLQQFQTPYRPSSTVERAPYEQAPPVYAYGTHASAIPNQPSGQYQQQSQDVPSYSQRGRTDAATHSSTQGLSSYELWDLSQRQMHEAGFAVQYPSSPRGNNEHRPGSRGDSRDRRRQEETSTRRSGRDAFIGEAEVEPARTSKKPRRRHGSSDIVNVTHALGQASLTAPAYAPGGLEKSRKEYEEVRRNTKPKQKSVKEHDIPIQRKRIYSTEESRLEPYPSEQDEANLEKAAKAAHRREYEQRPEVKERAKERYQRKKDEIKAKSRKSRQDEDSDARLRRLERGNANYRARTAKIGQKQREDLSEQDEASLKKKAAKADHQRVYDQRPEVKERAKERYQRKIDEINAKDRERRQKQREDSPSPRR